MITESYQHGFGRHSIFLTSHQQINATKWIFISQGLGVVAPMFGRLSFCLYMLQIVGHSSVWQRWSLLVMMLLQFLINTSCVIMIYAQCGTHVSALWGTEMATCLDPIYQTNYGYFQSAFNSFADLYLTLLPALIIWNLEIKPLVKAGLSFLLCLSFFAFIASVVKTWQIRILNERGDITWNFVDFVVWAALEIDLVIIVASIPTIKLPFTTRRKTRSSVYDYEMYASPSAKSKESSRRNVVSLKGAGCLSTTISEEDILKDQGGVRATVDVEVTSETGTMDSAAAAKEVAQRW